VNVTRLECKNVKQLKRWKFYEKYEENIVVVAWL
jgi:hypothetical protein